MEKVLVRREWGGREIRDECIASVQLADDEALNKAGMLATRRLGQLWEPLWRYIA